MHVPLDCDQVTDFLLKNIPLHYLQKRPDCLHGVLGQFPSVLRSSVPSTLLRLAESKQTVFSLYTLDYPTAFVICHTINKHQ